MQKKQRLRDSINDYGNAPLVIFLNHEGRGSSGKNYNTLVAHTVIIILPRSNTFHLS